MIAFRPPKSGKEWIILLMGAAFAIPAGYQMAMGTWSLTWPKAPGTVTYSTAKRGFRRYVVDIRYRYTYGGRDYAGNRPSFLSLLNRETTRSRAVDPIQARYPVGEHIQVAVNPGDAAMSVIEPGPSLDDVIPLGAGLLFVLVAVADRKGPRPARSPYRTAKVLAALGCALMVWGGYTLYTGWSSRFWPTAEGKILFARTYSGQGYENQIWYEYFVRNARYVASNYRNGGNSTPFRKVAESAAGRYAKGAAVRVYYNPASPSQAMLEPGVWYGNLVIPGIGLLLLAAAWLAKKYVDAVARLEQARKARAIH